MRKISANINPKLLRISGPVNIIRLEGNVHGINKVIYLFMDYHMGVSNQTQCANIFSQDVQKYFVNSFYELSKENNEKMYDFFLEIYPTELSNRRRLLTDPVDYKDKYIEEVVKFFRRIFVYDAKNNKVEISKLFKNIRLHYIDIRDYYKTNITEQVQEMSEIAHNFMAKDNIRLNQLERIIDLLYFMRRHLDFVVGVLSQEISDEPPKKTLIRPPSTIIDIDVLEYLAKKIKEKYKYPDVRREMNRLLNQSLNNFMDTITDIDAAISQFTEYADNIYNSTNRLVYDENSTYMYTYGLSIYTIRKMIVDIANRVDKLIEEQFIEYFARFIDIYFLRRFLDKDYITNAITYTGGMHSNTYVYELVKSFKFRITHVSYSKIADLDELNEEIKNKSLMEIQELLLPPNLQQCSDMSHFPHNFL